MKTRLLFIAIAYCLAASAQNNTWTQKANVGTLGRMSGVGFYITGKKGYIGLGRNGSSNYLHDMWEYDASNDTWTQKANYPGTGTFCSTALVIGSNAYVGLGCNPTCQTDWWEFDPSANTWTAKAVFPGAARYGAGGFGIGTKGYVLCGTIGGPPYLYDVWCYDQQSDAWVQKVDFPGANRNHPSAFAFNGKGYVGLGSTTWSNVAASDMWEYNPNNDSWTQKATCPGTARRAAMDFSIYNLLFVCCGLDGPGNTLQDLWEYDALTDVWTVRAQFPAASRWLGAGFGIGGNGYAGTGTDAALGSSYVDFWKYAPINAGVNDIRDQVSVSAYPNPCSSYLNLGVVSSGVAGNSGQINIFDASGNKVYSGRLSKGENRIETNNFASGVYFIEVHSEEGLAVKKIIKE